LAVHDMSAPELAADPRRAVGRLKMLLILLVSAAPVVAAYLAYFVVRPEGRTNYGELIDPPRPLPALNLATLDGQRFDPRSLHGQWLLVVVGPGDCTQACERRLFLQRQLREMLGRERERVDKLWLVTGDAPVLPALRRALEAAVPPAMLRADAAEVAAWLSPQGGRGVDEHLYLVDPMGQWMLRFPPDPDPQKAKRDLDRLLRASAAWDKPGRTDPAAPGGLRPAAGRAGATAAL
jgi:hypothetical protein